MNYLMVLRAFERLFPNWDEMSDEEKAAARAAFDKTTQAQMAKLLDAWTAFLEKMFPWLR